MPIQRIPFTLYKYQQSGVSAAAPNICPWRSSWRNPIQGYRKVSTNNPSTGCPCSNLQNQEIFSDAACCAYKETNKKNIIHKNGKINSITHNSHTQYLKSRCKTFIQNSSEYDIRDSEVRINCGHCPSTTPSSFPCKRIAYKPKNTQYYSRGAVSSSARLRRLKANSGAGDGCCGNPCTSSFTVKKYPCNPCKQKSVGKRKNCCPP